MVLSSLSRQGIFQWLQVPESYLVKDRERPGKMTFSPIGVLTTWPADISTRLVQVWHGGAGLEFPHLDSGGNKEFKASLSYVVILRPCWTN